MPCKSSSRTKSVDLRPVFVAAGLPEPCREYRFCYGRRWAFDYAWALSEVALEIEGGVWTRGRHVRPKGFIADIEKYNAAAEMGWRVIRATPEMIEDGSILTLLDKMLSGPR